MNFETIRNPSVCSASVVQISTRVDAPQAASDLSDQDIRRLPDGLQRAPLRRQLPYLAGEFCLVEALRHAGIRPEISENNCTPTSLDGPWSLTRTRSFASAAIPVDDSISYLGIDSERIFSSEAAQCLWDFVLTRREVAFFEWHAKKDLDRPRYLSLLYSAKESFNKAFQGLFKGPIDLQNVLIEPLLSEGQSNFNYTLMRKVAGVDPLMLQGEGRFEFDHDHVHTAIEVAK